MRKWCAWHSKGIGPAHEISGRLEYPRDLVLDRFDVFRSHCRQGGAATLARAFIAELQLVEHLAMLRIEEYQPDARIRQCAEQFERITALGNIE
jgi:hypothetical protein